MIEKFFTTEQVANILQVHPFTILKFIKQGKLKGVKLGRVYRIKESDVKEFLEERMTGGKPRKEEKAEEKVKKVEEKPAEVKEVIVENTSEITPQASKEKHFKIDDKGDDAEHYYVI